MKDSDNSLGTYQHMVVYPITLKNSNVCKRGPYLYLWMNLVPREAKDNVGSVLEFLNGYTHMSSLLEKCRNPQRGVIIGTSTQMGNVQT
jgi:hypothetical protein